MDSKSVVTCPRCKSPLERMMNSRDKYNCKKCSDESGKYIIWTNQFLEGFKMGVEQTRGDLLGVQLPC
jgi:primosomal protein N'